MYLYIVLSYTGTMPSKVIKAFTKDKYTHVSISKMKDLSTMYSFGRKHLHLPYPGGFIKENIKEGLYAKKDVMISIYKIPVSEESLDIFDKQIDFFNKNKDLVFYDFKGAIGIYFNRNVFSINGYVCSSFVGEILRNMNVVNEISYDMRPQDFMNLPNIELLFEGKSIEFAQGRGEYDEISKSNIWSL